MPATAKPPAFNAKNTRSSITAVAWLAWIVSTKCRQGAIRYIPRRKTISESVEPAHEDKKEDPDAEFLSFAGLLGQYCLIESSGERQVDGGLAVIEDKKIPNRITPITPPGSLSALNIAQHCTACQLCISACPNQVLRPSGNLMTFMQPEMSYERGYCRPECTKCSEVCPTGAIRPITVAEKSSIQIGHAVWVKKNCIPLTDGVDCGNCARHCPVGAIQMVPFHGRHRHRGGQRKQRTGQDHNDPGYQYGTLYRLRYLRKPVSGTSVQRDLCRRSRTPSYHLISKTKSNEKRT